MGVPDRWQHEKQNPAYRPPTDMMFYLIVLVGLSVNFLQMKCKLRKVVGYALLGYAVNVFILMCNEPNAPLIQSLILTSIVISMSFTVIMVKK